MIPDDKRIIDLTVAQLREIIENCAKKELNSQKQQQPADIVSIEEAIEITHLARQTIYQKVFERKIPFIKRPGSKKLLFSRKALNQWLLDDKQV